jgi:hypothetical protein
LYSPVTFAPHSFNPRMIHGPFSIFPVGYSLYLASQ